MNKDIYKSIAAVLAGLIFIGVSHTAMDAALEAAGVLPKGHLNVEKALILLVIGYRAILSLAGCYLTAKLAPKNPLKHSIILGAIGTLLSAVGAIVTARMNVAPIWYGLTLVIVALPIAWCAGKFFLMRNKQTLLA